MSTGISQFERLALFVKHAPKKIRKKYLTQIFNLGISMVELCRGLGMFVKTYIISACTGGKHRSPYAVSTCSPQCWAPRCEKRHLHPPQGFDRRCARPWRMVIRLRGESGSIPLKVFEWVFPSRCLWRCCLVVLHPRWWKISSIQQYLDINKHHRPFHQGTRTGVPLTVYLWYLAGVLGWNSWGWKNP